MNIFGWDVSKYDHDRGPVDMVRAFQEGIRFVTQRATIGTTYRDPSLGKTLNDARAVGMAYIGAYMVVRTPGSLDKRDQPGQVHGTLAEQCTEFINAVDRAAPWFFDEANTFIQVDVEHWSSVQGTTDNVSITDGVRVCQMLGRPATGFDMPVVLYAPKWAYGDTIPNGYPLWASSYVKGAQSFSAAYWNAGGDALPGWEPYSGQTPAILQFSSTATIAGQQPCDASAFRGTQGQFGAMLGASNGGDSVTSAQHKKWLNSGLKWKLADPLMFVKERCEAHGYTVYDIGNPTHLDHEPPEDHTPYSETGWPITTPYGTVTAIDIMPPAKGQKSNVDGLPLPDLKALGLAFVEAKLTGAFPDLKYMNWPSTGDLSKAQQISFKPDQHISSSSDAGHIHTSIRSDYVHSGTRFDPVARVRGQKGIIEMGKLMRVSDLHIVLSDGLHFRWLRDMDAVDRTKKALGLGDWTDVEPEDIGVSVDGEWPPGVEAVGSSSEAGGVADAVNVEAISAAVTNQVTEALQASVANMLSNQFKEFAEALSSVQANK